MLALQFCFFLILNYINLLLSYYSHFLLTLLLFCIESHPIVFTIYHLFPLIKTIIFQMLLSLFKFFILFVYSFIVLITFILSHYLNYHWLMLQLFSVLIKDSFIGVNPFKYLFSVMSCYKPITILITIQNVSLT